MIVAMIIIIVDWKGWWLVIQMTKHGCKWQLISYSCKLNGYVIQDFFKCNLLFHPYWWNQRFDLHLQLFKITNMGYWTCINKAKLNSQVK